VRSTRGRGTPPPLPRPLTSASESLIGALRVEDGIGLGLPQVDVLTRGFRPTDLVIVTGFAHSGKTQLINTMVLNNPKKRVLFFSLDDPAEMILAKLVAMYTGISAESLETRIRNDDEEAKAIIREAAEFTFENLLVVDDVIGIPSMQQAVAEATDLWGAAPDAIVIDYLEMMPGTATSDDDGANVKQKANDLKKWAKALACPLIVLHQGTRSNAKPGEPITMMSLGYSGEQQATIIVGVRRKMFKHDLEAWERPYHERTITVHVVKNKRPGGRCTNHDGVDFAMEPETGLVRVLTQDELNRLFDPDKPSAAAAAQTATQVVQGALDVGRSGPTGAAA
jgi:replicative DNA helicase